MRYMTNYMSEREGGMPSTHRPSVPALLDEFNHNRVHIDLAAAAINRYLPTHRNTRWRQHAFILHAVYMCAYNAWRLCLFLNLSAPTFDEFLADLAVELAELTDVDSLWPL